MKRRKIHSDVRKRIGARQGWRCFKCDIILSSTFDVDHIISLAAGGSNDEDNLCCLCNTCHHAKSQLEQIERDALYERKKREREDELLQQKTRAEVMKAFLPFVQLVSDQVAALQGLMSSTTTTPPPAQPSPLLASEPPAPALTTAQSCHLCGHRSPGRFLVSCTKCSKKFCDAHLRGRYSLDAHAEAATNKFVCPCCRGQCVRGDCAGNPDATVRIRKKARV